MKTDQLQLVSRATAPTDANLTDGRFYIDSATDQALVYVNGTWTNIGAGATGGASDWDTLYAADKSLNVNDVALTFAGSHATYDVFAITNATGSGSCLDLTQSGTGKDIDGTASAWSITSAGVITATGLTIGDDENITFGASSDATIDWEGTNNVLNFAGACDFDDAITTQSTVTIAGGAGADALIVTAGDVELSDSSVNITDADNAASFTLTNATITDGANLFTITADAITDKSILYIDNGGDSITSGYFINCNDDDASLFTVGANGAVVIAGSAGGTDALTITTGDLFISDSDQNIIESENGTSTLLLLDNKAGAVGSAEAVLKVDAGGVVNAAGFGIYATFTGAAAAGATVVGIVPDAGSLGMFINGGTVDTREALKIDADPTAYDVAYIHSDGVIAADKAILNLNSAGAIASGGNVLRLDVTGAPASGAVYCEFDFAGLTDTNENVGLLIDAGGKKVQALSIDADPIAGSVALFHTDGATADNKAVVEITSAGEPAAAGSNVLRVQFTGTATNTPTLVEVDGAGKDVRALSIDADPASLDVAYIHTDGVIADNKAVLSLHSAGAMAAGSSILRLAQAGTPAAATSYTLEIDNSGSDSTNNPVCVRINNDDSTGAVIQATTAGAGAPLLDLYATHADAVGAVIKTYHNSATPVDNDVVFSLQMWGMDDTHAEEWGRIEVAPLDVTSASSTSSMTFYVDVAGTAETALTLKTNYAIVGAGTDTGYVTSSGAYNLVISTNEGTDSGTITIADAANSDITIAPNGIGQTRLTAASFTTTAVTSAHTMTIAEIGFVTCTSGGAYAITLPAVATSAGAWYTFKKTDAAANAITLTGNGAETIDGSNTNATIDAQYDTISIYCDGSAWYIFSEDLA